jgi:transcriptional regulator with GAF, ATPase, and Fis domain
MNLRECHHATGETMNIDEKDFFRQVTLRICGSLEIEKALWQCLLYIRNFLPASQMSLHIYHRDIGVVETVASATRDGFKALALNSRLSDLTRKNIEKQGLNRVRAIARLGDDPVCSPVAEKFNALDLPAVVSDLVLEGKLLGILAIFGNGRIRFTQEHVRLISAINEPFAVALTNSLRYRELQKLRDLLADDSRYFQDELRRMVGEDVIGADFGLKSVMDLVRQVAPMDSPVLLLGETGSGKDVVANAIHKTSFRRQAPFIKVNCGAIPPTLMDSELFGHEKGAFTGALSQKRGRIERAHSGTLFLDEIGELSPDAQVRLLRVLQEKEIERVGGSGPTPVDIRVIAATHRNLESMMGRGTFREDLYFRLRVFPIPIPPLRNRMMDLPALVQYFIQKKAREMKRSPAPGLTSGALDRLMAYHWPGNVRELENAVERALILSRGEPLVFDDIAPKTDKSPGIIAFPLSTPIAENLDLDAMTRQHIHRILDLCKGRVEGENGAARRLNVHPSTLRKRMRKLGIPFGRKAIGRL